MAIGLALSPNVQYSIVKCKMQFVHNQL